MSGSHQEEGREVVSPRQSGLAIDRAGLLAHGGLARAADLGNLAVAEALEKQEGPLLLGVRQPPPLELPVDRVAEPRDHPLAAGEGVDAERE